MSRAHSSSMDTSAVPAFSASNAGGKKGENTTLLTSFTHDHPKPTLDDDSVAVTQPDTRISISEFFGLLTVPFSLLAIVLGSMFGLIFFIPIHYGLILLVFPFACCCRCSDFCYKLSWRVGLAKPPVYPRTIPLNSRAGVRSCPKPNIIEFSTPDGLILYLTHWFSGTPPINVTIKNKIVVIMHGLTTSSDMFIMPEHINIVDYMLSQGYTDVFTVDNRISKRFPYNLEGNNYTVDDIAAYDNVAMIEALNHWSQTKYGEIRGIHVIAHCVNAMSILCTAAAGLIKPEHQVNTIVVNSTGLTPAVHGIAKLKMLFAPNVSNSIFSYISPRFIREPIWTLRRVAGHFVSLLHWECEVPECHMASFMWSYGFPGVWRHEQITDITHHRTGDLYGSTSMHYDMHITKCILAGKFVKFNQEDPNYFPQLPLDYLQSALDGKIITPILLTTGSLNGVFYDSNIILNKKFEDAKKAGKNHIRSPYKLHIFEGYGHQDPLMGKNNYKDIFPVYVDWMTKHEGTNNNFEQQNSGEEERGAATSIEFKNEE